MTPAAKLAACAMLLVGCGRIEFDPVTVAADAREPFNFALVPSCAQLAFAQDATCGADGIALNNDLGDSAGAAYIDHQVDVRSGLHVQLQLRFTELAANHADGATFVLHADPRGTSAIGPPGALGLNTIQPSIAFEMDTFDDGPQMAGEPDPDPNNTHFGYDVDGDIHSAIVRTTPFNFHDGTPFFVWIDYAPGSFAVFVAQTNAKPATPLIQGAPTGPWLDSPVWIGMTGGAANMFMESHDVLAWTMQTD